MSRRVLPLVVVGLALSGGAASAQELHLQVSRGPYYAGIPIEIELSAEGFEEEPQPEAQVPPPARGRLELLGVAPNVSSSITIVNGRVSQTKAVQFVYRYRYLTREPGPVEIGPFRVRQARVTRSVPSLHLRVQEVSSSDRLRVQLKLPDSPLYVGARAPLTLEFWLERMLQKRLHNYTLQVPIFDRSESFRFVDTPSTAGDTPVNIETASGRLKLNGNVREEADGQTRYTVISVTRTVVPLEPGTFEIVPASLIVEEAVRWKRDLFGQRRATHVTKWRASDRKRILKVKPLPLAGQPASFAGAIGRGFSLEVSADRTVVQTGEPITLTLTVRGAGNLRSAGFPPLDAEGLLPAESFRVPEGDLTGQWQAREKRFAAVVRVLNDGVQEIPALAYSWFDPDKGQYETTHSRPVALSVRPARVIGAQDVVSGKQQDSLESTSHPLSADASASGGSGGLVLTGADLAIESDPEVLLRPSRVSWGGAWLPGGLYAGSGFVLFAALWDRRRRRIDPALLQRRRLLEAELRRVRRAASGPPREAAGEFSQALRRMIAAVPEARSPDVEALLAECDVWSYAPPGVPVASESAEGFGDRAVAAAETILERSRT